MKTILYIFMFLALSLQGLNAKTLSQELNNLTEKQYKEFIQSLKDGKDDNLSLTLAAIAWQESRFGKMPVNTKDGKYGSFCKYQILAQTAAKRHDMPIFKVVAKLLFDKTFCKENAIAELKFWNKVHKGNWRKTVASYNAGFQSINNPLGALYADRLAAKVRAIETYIAKNDIEY